MHTYDVVIIGAGPGGSAAGHYLAKAGLRVLMFDKFDFPRDKTCGDGLTPLAVDVLDNMGVLETLPSDSYRVRGLEIFAPRGHSTNIHLPEQRDRPSYAMIIPRLILDEAICHRAIASGADFQGRVTVTDIEPCDDGVIVKGRGQGQTTAVKARIAVVATGANVKLLLTTGILPETPTMMLAARTYYENVSGLNGQIQFHFDGVPLPGYGWVFPLSETSANVGAGFFRSGRATGKLPATPKAAFEQFVQSPTLQAQLANAEQTAPIKGYPLRIDFATAPTYGQRTILVGEAAGLVNPLTGEGIDYALESGRIAARHIAAMFDSGDFSAAQFVAYDTALRHQFQSLFVFCRRMQRFLRHPALLNRLVTSADRFDDLKMLLADIVLGNLDASEALSRKNYCQSRVVVSDCRLFIG